METSLPVIVTDIKFLELKGLERDQENQLFIKLLGSLEGMLLNHLFSGISTGVSDQIDCLQCGNCCRKLEADITEEEAERLARLKQISKETFLNLFVALDLQSGDLFLHKTPCTFLDNNNCCSIYDKRPNSCREYPHINTLSKQFSLTGIFSNYGVCPIVFNTIEILKRKLNFNPGATEMS